MSRFENKIDLSDILSITLSKDSKTFEDSQDVSKQIKELEKKFKRKSIKPTEVRRLSSEFYLLIKSLSKKELTESNYKAIADLYANHAIKVMKIFVNGVTFGFLNEMTRIYNLLNSNFSAMQAVTLRKQLLNLLVSVIKSNKDLRYLDLSDLYLILPISLTNNNSIYPRCDPEFEHKIATKLIKLLTESFEVTKLACLWMFCGRLSLVMRKPDQAFMEYKKAYGIIKTTAVRNEWPSPSVWYMKNFVLYQIGICNLTININLAEKVFLKCRKAYDNPECAIDQNTTGVQVQYASLCIGLASKSNLQLGHIYYQNGQIDKAIQKYEESFEHLGRESPLDLPTKLVTANVLKEADYEKAIDRLMSCYKIAKCDVNHLKHCTKNKQSCDTATEIFETAVAHELFNHDLLEINLVMENRNSICPCVVEFMKEVYFHRAEAQLNLGNEFKALEDLKKSYPELHLSDKLLTMPEILKLMKKFGLLEEAVDFLEGTFKDFKESEFKHLLSFELAKLHFKLGNFEIARKLFEDVLNKMKTDFDLGQKCYFYVGRCHFELQNYQSAIQYFALHIGKRRYLEIAKCQIMSKKYEESRKSLLKAALTIPSLILLIVNAQILGKPCKNYLVKLIKLCDKSLVPLRNHLNICPQHLQRSFLDILVYRSKRNSAFVELRYSWLCQSKFRVQ